MRLFAPPELLERCQDLHILTLQLIIAGGDATHALIDSHNSVSRIFKDKNPSREESLFLDSTGQIIFNLNEKFIGISDSVQPNFSTLNRYLRAGQITRATNLMSNMSDELESFKRDLTTAYANMDQLKETITNW